MMIFKWIHFSWSVVWEISLVFFRHTERLSQAFSLLDLVPGIATMKMHTLAFPEALILFGSLILVEGAKDKVFPFGDEFGHASDKNCKEFSEGKEGALLGVACEDAVRWLLNETGTNFIQAFPQLSDDWCGCFVKDVKKGKCDKIEILADGTCDTEAPTKSPSDSPSLIPSSSPSDLPSFKPSTRCVSFVRSTIYKQK